MRPRPPKMKPTLPWRFASSGLTRYLRCKNQQKTRIAIAGRTYGMTIFAIMPHMELTQIPIPTVFDLSMADPTSAKMT